ncbi:exodeoxyribonuclease VII large subunit [Anaerolentibacter hominis]|uniref:exodeoxyribonuclease VII large subunit n=1 Tax=Anaerolentibacter hominis TaxID=3079009 RepID=UPI0031B85071
MQQVYSVSQINAYIKDVLQSDYVLNHIYIKGEVSNCKYHTSGHIYFTLKDAGAALACVMFAGSRKGLSYRMKDGDKVIVLGNIGVYEQSGRYQLYAREIIPDGTGSLYLKFEQLKKELEEEGLFSPLHKKEIPFYAARIGIVTASTGAAIQDIIHIAGRRNPYVQLVLCPALVQGEGAVSSIIKGIRRLDAMNLDIIIVGRGGGSIEELWAFNEEAVARAIYRCHTPVISAVGHETDTTIADYVADLRAPTPSAAAELAVCDIHDILHRLDQYRMRLNHAGPMQQLNGRRQRLMELEERLTDRIERILTDKKHQLSLAASRLNSVSPLRKLEGGYAYVEDRDGRGVKRAEQVSSGEKLRIRLMDGTIHVTADKIEKGRPD